jgi:hypothetical protein
LTILTFFFQNASITYFILLKKTKNQKKGKKKKYAGVVRPPQHISFFFLNKKCDGSILERKKVKVIELPQFESLGGKMLHLKLWRQKCKLVDTSGGKV